MPMLVVTLTTCVPRIKGSRNAAIILSETSSASEIESISVSSRINSSPPSRATVSYGAHYGGQPVPGGFQDFIADAVAQSIIHIFEAVEIEH